MRVRVLGLVGDGVPLRVILSERRLAESHLIALVSEASRTGSEYRSWAKAMARAER